MEGLRCPEPARSSAALRAFSAAALAGTPDGDGKPFLIGPEEQAAVPVGSLAEIGPGLVVVRPAGVGDAPPCVCSYPGTRGRQVNSG